MNKQELIDSVADVTGDSKAATGEAIDAVLGAIKSALSAGDAVQLIGFGSFDRTARGAHRAQSVDRR